MSKKLAKRTRGSSSTPRARLRVEELEHRVLLATRLWSGAGLDANWATAANWGGTAPVAGDDLVFPAGALQTTNTNNFAAGTSFNSITFQAGGYNVSGNPIALVAGLSATGTTGSDTFNLNTTLSAAESFTSNSGTALNLGGALNLNGFTLNVSGNVSFSATASYNVQLNAATGYDQLNVTGTVNLGGSTLNTALGFASAVGNTFTIVHSTAGLSGTFNGLANGAIFSAGGDSFQISYTSTDAVLTQVKANTTTALSSLANPAVNGQAVTYIAAVTPVSPNTGTPTGTVTFTVDGVAQPNATLSNGQATLSVSNFTVASHTVSVAYNGDANFNTSSSASLTQTVNAASTTTAVSSSGSPAVFGQAVTFSATVTANSPSTATPAGSAQFFDGATSLGTVSLDNTGSASLTTSALSVGSHTITVTFTGAGFNSSTSAALTQTINQASSSTTVSASASPLVFGQAVTFTASVSAVSPGAGTPTGTVTFTVDGVAQPNVTLSNGQATFSSSTLGIGSHTVTVTYNGDGNFTTSSSAGLSETVSKASSSTAVTTSANSTVFGQAVTYTATVSAVAPGAGTPTGTVTFTIDGVAQPNVTLSSGQATLSTSSLSVGSHTVTVAYNGDGNFITSTSASLGQTVSKASSSTAVSSSTSAVYGQAVTFTATVTAVSPGAGTPTGTVTFTVDGVAQPNVTLSSGQATFSSSTLSTGSHTVTAAYNGDGNFTTSTSVNVSDTVTKGSSSTSVAASVNPSVFGQAVTFTATVTAVAPSSGTPTGTVTFTVDGVAQPNVTLSGGQATWSSSTLSVGSHTVTAAYNGDGNFLTGTSASFSETVGKASSATAVTSSATPSVFGQQVTLTATVSAVAPGAGTPTGTVTFTIDGVVQPNATLSSGQATLKTSALSVGSHTVTAAYNGDGNFTTNTSTSFSQTVNKASSSTALTSSAAPSEFGQSITFMATVTAVSPGGGTPTGTVTFMDGSATLGTATLSSGTASLAVSTLAVFTHSISAVYAGDGNFNTSASASLSQAVKSTLWGVPWPNPGHVTLSFVPDGTSASSYQSNLFQTLNAAGSTAAWEQEILRAFQTWADNANINIAVVPDGGQAMGTAGAAQSDPRFGDARIAMAAMTSSTHLGDTSPFELSGSTWGGDMLLNSRYNFGINGQGTYDLFSVALHEASHVFGIPDQSTDPSSATYNTYNGVRTGLSSSDIAFLQAVYSGPRAADPTANSSRATATFLAQPDQSPVTADIASSTDADYYSFTTPAAISPATTTSITVQLQTAGISLLEPSVTVYDASGNVVGSGAATSPLSNNVTVTVNNAQPNATYYVSVTSASGAGVFGIGRYQMSIQFPTTITPTGGGGGGSITNTSLATAQVLGSAQMTANGQGFTYISNGGISLTALGNYYQVTAPTLPVPGAELLTVSAAATDANLLNPSITVYNASQVALTTTVINNNYSGTFTVQLPSITAGAVYYIGVSALSGTSQNIGNFYLSTTFNADSARTFQSTANGTLTQANSVSYQTLTVTQSELLQFSLSANIGSSTVASAVMMTIYDQNNNAVFTQIAYAGAPIATGFVYLQSGITYTVRYNAATQSGASLPNLTWWMAARKSTDPMSITPVDPSLLTGITTGSSSGGSVGILPIINPYSNPKVSG
jgi:hypothetical protein